MKFTAVGDVIIGRRIQEDFKGYEQLAPIINKGDARFFNLETTLHYEGECFASQTSGGTYLRVNPEVLYDIKKFGFNMTSFNNNHSMDFSFDGLLRTFEEVEKSGLVHSGAGRNSEEASAPKYLETSSGRVALISVNSTLPGLMVAGEQTNRIKGRPGVNPLRCSECVEVKEEDYKVLERIIDESKINAYMAIVKKEGYYGGESDGKALNIKDLKFVSGNETRYTTKCDEKDLERVKKSIYEAKLQADYIIVSVHSHQTGGEEKEEPAEFLKEFAHFCIDNGVNAVVGHGPHLLRPIEIYKDCPIFYSLGNFIQQLYNVDFAPEEFYSQYGLNSSATVHELLKKRSKDFTVGLMADERMFVSVIPYWKTENGKLTSLTLYPIKLSMNGNKSEIGLPSKTNDLKLYEDFIKRCENYGTKITENADGSMTCEKFSK